MERCLSGIGLGLGWLLGRLPTFRQQASKKKKKKSFGGLGHVRPVNAPFPSLAATVTMGQSKIFWQTSLVTETPCIVMLNV